MDPSKPKLPWDPIACDRCGKTGGVRRRQNTARHNDTMNWATLCPLCQLEADAHWEERWQEYYEGLI
jgi:hypothetical protein